MRVRNPNPAISKNSAKILNLSKSANISEKNIQKISKLFSFVIMCRNIKMVSTNFGIFQNFDAKFSHNFGVNDNLYIMLVIHTIVR
jgi:hypothetical protein